LLMLSTFHAPGTQMIRCKERSGKICEYRRSDVTCDYTSNLSAVEQTDYYCCSYALMCKRYKWWHKIYYFESWKYVLSIASSCLTMCDSEATWSQLHLHYKEMLPQELLRCLHLQCTKESLSVNEWCKREVAGWSLHHQN